jgi:chromate transport protein ChrA
MSSPQDVQTSPQARSLVGLARYFGGLGASGFGGPIALVGYMRRDLVEERGWYTDEEYRQALAVGQTFPGPLTHASKASSKAAPPQPPVRSPAPRS